MKRIYRPLLSIGVFVGLWLAIEGVLRLAGWAPASGERDFRFDLLDEEGSEVIRYERHPTRFYTLKAAARRSDVHAGRYALGAWPFRGRPAVPAPEDIVRIAVVGDSCVYGAAVNVSQTLPELLQQGLEARGHDPARLQVLNFGVPGYSTVQIGAMVDEVIATWRPAAIVMYPAAWNDQGPALGANDFELRERRRQRTFRDVLRPTAIHAFLTDLVGREPPPAPALDAILDGWSKGAPPLGYRVPEQAVRVEVERMIASCREAGVRPLVIVPAHPRETQTKHPRVMRDGEAVARAARANGVAMVDAEALLGDLEPAQHVALFADYIHPSPDGMKRIAEAVLPELEKVLAPTGPRNSGGTILAIEPAQMCTLGDQAVRVRFDAQAEGDEAPVILVGGAPLVDLRRLGPGAWEGTAISNGPGRLDVVVQTSRAILVREEGIEALPPRIEVQRDEETWTIRFLARAGDRAVIGVTTKKLRFPRWLESGAWWLDEEALLPVHWTLEAGPDGRAEQEIPRPWMADVQTFYLQGQVTPHGEADGASTTRVTALTAVDL